MNKNKKTVFGEVQQREIPGVLGMKPVWPHIFNGKDWIILSSPEGEKLFNEKQEKQK